MMHDRGIIRGAVRLAMALACCGMAAPATAQELEVRLWSYLPTDANFASAAYVSSHADISVDPALGIRDTSVEMKTYLVAYQHSFALLGHSARIDLRQPWKQVTWEGILGGTPAEIEREGWGDGTVRLSVLVLGGPPLKGPAYAAYRAAHPNETLLGLGLAIDVPTGEYMSDKVLNIGNNRYAFRPQLGFVQNFGPWAFETTAMVALTTDNNDFFNGGTLEQDPLYSLQSHVSYTLPQGLWFSAGIAGSTGGERTVNGIARNDPKDAFFFGASAGYPLLDRLALKIGYVGSRRQVPTAVNSDSLYLALSTFW